MSSPLDVLRAQALAMQALAAAQLATLDSMQTRAPLADGEEVPVSAPHRPATAPAGDGATPASAPGARTPPRPITFEGPIDMQAVASAREVPHYNAGSRDIAPDSSGDLRPTTKEAP